MTTDITYNVSNNYCRRIYGTDMIDAIERYGHKLADAVSLGNAAGTHIEKIVLQSAPTSKIGGKTFIKVIIHGRGLDLAHRKVDPTIIRKSTYIYCSLADADKLNGTVIYSK